MAHKNALGFGGGRDSSLWKKGFGTFQFKGQKVKLSLESGESYIFHENLIPKFPQKIKPSFQYFIELVLEQDQQHIQEISNVRPAKWMGLKMVGADMTRQDGIPSPYTYTTDYNGKEVETTAFYIFYKCIEGEYEGVLFPNRYIYKFEQDPANSGYTRWLGNYENPKATQLHRVVDHLTMLGAVDEPITWPDDGNVLPELLARILAAGVVVNTAGGGKFATISEMVEAEVTKGFSGEDAQAELELKEEDDEWNDDDWGSDMSITPEPEGEDDFPF